MFHTILLAIGLERAAVLREEWSAAKSCLLAIAFQTGDPNLRHRATIISNQDPIPSNSDDLDTRVNGTSQTNPCALHDRTDTPDLGLVLRDKFKLLRLLGEGGMGQVWLAKQLAPVRRLVAIKLMKYSSQNTGSVQRFELERQTLALMDHASISKIHDGGVTDSGLQYLVMEFVNGVIITEFCKRQALGIRQRVQLFVSVASAVEHAHQKRVIHRDIKPSNVLITRVDGQPLAKVIDFGIAKQNEDSALSLDQTGVGFVGTPHYMSPEQIGLQRNAVDTRSDIYSMGVLLYELLTGSLPFASTDLYQLLTDIRSVEPETPSKRITASLQETKPDDSRLQFTAAELKELRTDLDWIVMKCLSKDPDRRYQTANAFREDLQHYLHGLPVSAHPPTRLYLLSKAILRHRLAVSTVVLVVALFIVGLTATLNGYRNRLQQQELLIKHQQTLANSNSLLLSVFENAGSMSLAEGEADIRTAIKSRLGSIIDELKKDQIEPSVARESLNMRLAVAQAAIAVGEFQQAFEIAKAVHRQSIETRSPECEVSARLALSRVCEMVKDPEVHADYVSSNYCRDTYNKAVQLLGARSNLAFKCQNQWTYSLYLEKRYYESRELAKTLLSNSMDVLQPNDSIVIQALHLHAANCRQLFLNQEALTVNLDCLKRLGGDFESGSVENYHDDLPRCLRQVCMGYSRLGDIEKARKCETMLMDVCDKHLGIEHWNSLTSRLLVAMLRYERGEYLECLSLCGSIRLNPFGANAKLASIHSQSIMLQIDCHKNLDRVDESIRIAKNYLETKTDELSEIDPDTLKIRWRLAYLQDKKDGTSTVETFLRESLAKCEQLGGRDHPGFKFLKSAMNPNALEHQTKMTEAQKKYAFDWCDSNIALKSFNSGWPKVSCSFVSPYDRVESLTDGFIDFRLVPNNRWTAFQSPNPVDWVRIDFGQAKQFDRVAVYLYSDEGIGPPVSLDIQVLAGEEWVPVNEKNRVPMVPTSQRPNIVIFTPVNARALQVSFTHAPNKRSGATEIIVSDDSSEEWLQTAVDAESGRWKTVNECLEQVGDLSSEQSQFLYLTAATLGLNLRTQELTDLANRWHHRDPSEATSRLILRAMEHAANQWLQRNVKVHAWTIYGAILDYMRRAEFPESEIKEAESLAIALEPAVTSESPLSLHNRYASLLADARATPIQRYNFACAIIQNMVRFEKTDLDAGLRHEIVETSISAVLEALNSGKITLEHVLSDSDLGPIRSELRSRTSER